MKALTKNGIPRGARQAGAGDRGAEGTVHDLRPGRCPDAACQGARERRRADRRRREGFGPPRPRGLTTLARGDCRAAGKFVGPSISRELAIGEPSDPANRLRGLVLWLWLFRKVRPTHSHHLISQASIFAAAERGAATTRRSGGLTAGLRMPPPITPFPDGGGLSCTGASRVKGEPLRDAFFRSWMAGKKPRRRPAGRPAKQQPDAALEAACHLSRQWSLRGGGEGRVGGRDHLAQVAASEIWSAGGRETDRKPSGEPERSRRQGR